MKKTNLLSKSEMKKILGGVQYPDAKKCSVTCSGDTYACCNGGGETNATCVCKTADAFEGDSCLTGGPGETKCEIV